MNIDQYIFNNFSMDEEFKIQEIFINIKGQHLSNNQYFKGNRKTLMEKIVLKTSDIDELLNALQVYDFTVNPLFYFQLISFETILLN